MPEVPNPLQPLVSQITKLICRIEELIAKLNTSGGGSSGGGGSQTVVVVVDKKTNSANVRSYMVGTVSMLVVPENPKRLALSLINIGPAAAYLGVSNTVSGASGANPGYYFPAGASAYEDKYTGPIYCVVDAGTTKISVWEESE